MRLGAHESVAGGPWNAIALRRSDDLRGLVGADRPQEPLRLRTPLTTGRGGAAARATRQTSFE